MKELSFGLQYNCITCITCIYIYIYNRYIHKYIGQLQLKKFPNKFEKYQIIKKQDGPVIQAENIKKKRINDYNWTIINKNII